jgi:uncharacterized protein YbcC (UPF0753/DUF2309 family)
MEYIKEEYKPTEKFIEKMKNLSWKDYRQDFECDETCKNEKKLRNDYHNRMKPTNLMIYFMDWWNADQSVDIQNLKLKIIKLEQEVKDLNAEIQEYLDDDSKTLNAIGFVVNECH